MKCPLCGCEEFYIKNPEDEFETFEFRVADDGAVSAPEEGVDPPEVGCATETYCNQCSWHGKIGNLKTP